MAMADIKVRNLKRFDETAGCLWCPAGLSIRASGAATGSELRSIWTGRAHYVHARLNIRHFGDARPRIGARTLVIIDKCSRTSSVFFIFIKCLF